MSAITIPVPTTSIPLPTTNKNPFHPPAPTSTPQTAKFTYLQPLPLYRTQKPYLVLTHLNESHSRSNLAWHEPQEEKIWNIRNREAEFSLDTQGFEFVGAPTSFEDWDNNGHVEERYLQEVEDLLKKEVEGVEKVVIFDWRRRAPHNAQEFTNLNNPSEPLSPASQVHLDQSPQGVLKRVKLLLGDEAPEALKGRIRVINVWRPLFTVQDRPLALCDGRTIGYEDLMETDLVRVNYVGSTMFGNYRKGFKWYFLDQQTKDEVCLFKNFDSRAGVKSAICPHVSFQQRVMAPGERVRESIEVRALVFTSAETEERLLRREGVSANL